MNTTKSQIGTYAIDHELLAWKDTSTAHIFDENHCGPMIKFVGGIVPQQGDPVLITSVLDACWNRGEGQHRPGVKRVLRVKKIETRDDRPLYPIELVRIETGVPEVRGWHLNAEWALVTRYPAAVPIAPPMVEVVQPEWMKDTAQYLDPAFDDVLAGVPARYSANLEDASAAILKARGE